MRLLFIPDQIQPDTNERTPKLREILAKNHTVVGIRDEMADIVYGQRKNKVLRYSMYFFNNIYLFWRCLLEARRSDVDLLFCEGPHYALIGVFVSKILRKPCVWDSHGNTLVFCQQLGKSKAYTAASVALERILGEQIDALITVSEKDKQAYEGIGVDPSKIHVIPTCVDYSTVHKTSKSREMIRRELGLTDHHMMLLFFGSLHYAPNRQAVEYIDRVLAPSLSQAFPNVKIFIAGRGESAPNPHPSVTFLGFVPSIYDLIRASDVCIAPLWSGVGILTKVLDMMACGKPTVVTPLAKDGIPELLDNRNVIIALNREDFVAKTSQLLKRKDSYDTIGRRAREMVEMKYTWDKARAQLNELFEETTKLRSENQGGIYGW